MRNRDDTENMNCHFELCEIILFIEFSWKSASKCHVYEKRMKNSILKFANTISKFRCRLGYVPVKSIKNGIYSVYFDAYLVSP